MLEPGQGGVLFVNSVCKLKTIVGGIMAVTISWILWVIDLGHLAFLCVEDVLKCFYVNNSNKFIAM